MGTLFSIVKDNWQWRRQIGQLAVFELKKRSRGAMLGWAWLLVKPLIYVAVFWFALEVGLRAGRGIEGDYPYFLWLISGLIPWFFMQEMISNGSDVYHRFPYLVKKVKFPLDCVSAIYVLSSLIIHLAMVVLLFIIYFLYGLPLDAYLLQVPVLVLLSFVFWTMFSIFTSQLSGISKDFAQLMKSLSQPFFWLSGIIFDMGTLAGGPLTWIVDLSYFNPVTFFVTAMRDALCYKTWVWENSLFIAGFAVMFFGTMILMCIAYRKLHSEIADNL